MIKKLCSYPHPFDTPLSSTHSFAIKVGIEDKDATAYFFKGQKTMYGGKAISAKDRIYIFDSDHEGGQGLIARGIVTFAEAVPKVSGIDRQTPRVNITVKCQDRAKRKLGRNELKAFSNWKDGRPETELNFKFYRQATNKVIGISESAAAFLSSFF